MPQSKTKTARNASSKSYPPNIPKPRQKIQDYIVEGYLGSGTFGNVLEVSTHTTEERFALKIIRSQYFNRQQVKEVSLLKRIRDLFPNEETLLQIKSAFTWQFMEDDKEFKTSQCILFPKFEMTLTHLLRGHSSSYGVTMASVSHITFQLVHALKCLKKTGIIHRDIKPDNIMVREPPAGDEIKICLIDFGSATSFNQSELKTYVQSRFYRAPEVMLGHKYSFDVDMWSLGCVVVEMVFGKPLYLGQNESEQLNLIHQFQGPFPRKMIERASSPLASLFQQDYDFEAQKIVYHCRGLPLKHYWSSSSLELVCLEQILPKPLRNQSKDMSFDHPGYVRRSFADFVQGCLQIDFTRRWTPRQASGHPFLQFWGDKDPASPFHEYHPPSRSPIEQSPTSPRRQSRHPIVYSFPDASRDVPSSQNSYPSRWKTETKRICGWQNQRTDHFRQLSSVKRTPFRRIPYENTWHIQDQYGRMPSKSIYEYQLSCERSLYASRRYSFEDKFSKVSTFSRDRIFASVSHSNIPNTQFHHSNFFQPPIAPLWRA